MEDIVRKFVDNKATSEEIQVLQEYFKTAEGLQCLDRLMNEHEASFHESHLSAIRSENELSMLPPKGRGLRRQWIGIAASVTAMVVIAAGFFYASRTSTPILYKTAYGAKQVVTLPDGTIVTLNGNSSLTYNETEWRDDLRPVQFSGEAYFQVKSNPGKPFIVNTSDISIKVLGTTFNVKSYEEDPKIETTLVEGRVLIEKTSVNESPSETFELLPEHKATFTKADKTVVLEETHSASEAAWVKGSLIFEDESFGEIVKDLERWYGVKIQIEDQAALNCRFNTVVENETLEEVMKLFAAIGNVDYAFTGKDTLVIKGSVCTSDRKNNEEEIKPAIAR